MTVGSEPKCGVDTMPPGALWYTISKEASFPSPRMKAIGMVFYH
jgi:hypothetical protein